MKIILAVLLLVAAVSAEKKALCSSTSDHTIILGTCEGTPFDSRNVEVPAKILPIPGSTSKDITITTEKPITCIKVIDKVENGHGGCPSIAKGGVKFTYVTIHLLSQFASEMNFDIEVWIAS